MSQWHVEDMYNFTRQKKHALYYDFAKDMFSGSRYDIIDIYDTSKMCLINKIVK
jgi:hypothetical protein